MENNKKQKKKNRKPLYILAVFFVIFGFFIYLISRPSPEDTAKTELASAYTKENVKAIWEKYKPRLHDDENFLFAVRTKLSSLSLNEEEIKECIKWLPPAPISLNIIVVPDLSRRIVLIPGQIDSDKKVLDAIWASFVTSCGLKKNSHDSLIIDVTDKHQAGGDFEQIANNLRFDLSNHQGKSNRLFFTDDLSEQYRKSINSMYQFASGKSLGADYHLYFRQYLEPLIKKNDLFITYKNKVIVLTDGYLEPETETAYTKIKDYKHILYPAVRNGNIEQVIEDNNLCIPPARINLSETEVLICEVFERQDGEGKDKEILEAYWKLWLKRMGVKNPVFIEHQKASSSTSEIIKKFISSK